LGLSLPLAARILSLYGGRLGVENLTPPGLKITVLFKKGSPLTTS